MIEVPTVLVLGAGASMPFGFPSGKKLVTLICDTLEGDSPKVDLLQRHGYQKRNIHKFRENLILSGRSSVDSFLEHRTDFLEIGKEAIAAALLNYELTHRLFNTNMDNNWYQYLFSRLNTSFTEFDKNKISIVTFNYDRSLEHYLFTALKHSYNKDDEECAEKLSKIPIIHLHGKLGKLPWEKHGCSIVPYDITSHSDKLGLYVHRGGKNIKIIHENVKENEEFKTAHQLLSEAKRIYFLGFGFNQTNIERLKINYLPNNKSIWSTCLGLSEQKKRGLGRLTNAPNKIYDVDVYTFFHDHAVLS